MISSRQRHYYAGALLGIATLLSSSLEQLLLPQFPLSISHFFLILAALTGGLEAALIAFVVGYSPSILFDTGNFRYTVQAAAILTSIITLRSWHREVPAFFVVALTWLIVIIPAYTLSPEAQWHRSIPDYYLALQTLIDIGLTAGAALLLCTPWVCEAIAGKPFQPQHDSLITNAAGMSFSLVALGGILITPNSGLTQLSIERGSYDLLVVLSFTVIITGLASVGGKWLSSKVERISLHHQKARLSVSGLSQNFSEGNCESLQVNSQATSAGVNSIESLAIEGTCTLNRAGKVLSVNSRFIEIIQTPEKVLEGRKLFDLPMDNALRAALQEVFEKYKTHEQHRTELKLHQMPKQLRYFSVALETQTLEHTGEFGTRITLKEITNRRSIESHLLEAQKMKNLGSVMGSIAHSFNNSLTAIIGRASFALRTHDECGQRIALEEIRSQAQKAGELVWKLLEFAEGKPALFQKLSVKQLLISSEELLQRLMGERYQLTVDCQEEPLYFSGDRNLMLQVLTELVTNSKDSYGDKSGRIEVSLSREFMDQDIAQLHPGAKAGEYARIIVKDYGCGMSAEMLSHAFAPLVSSKAPGAHSGLGLSIVYAILRAHDGFMVIESFPSKGTTVSVYLPENSQGEELPHSPARESSPSKQSLNTLSQLPSLMAKPPENETTILIVEDQPEIRDLIGKMVTMLGYKVSTCSDAIEASQLHERRKFDLLLVDMMMPRVSGLEFIREIQKYPAEEDTAYILMSGYGNLESSCTDLCSDRLSHLPKPFDIETLETAIKDTLLKPSRNPQVR